MEDMHEVSVTCMRLYCKHSFLLRQHSVWDLRPAKAVFAHSQFVSKHDSSSNQSRESRAESNIEESLYLCAWSVFPLYPCTRFIPPVHRPRRWTTLPPRCGAARAVPAAASQPVGRAGGPQEGAAPTLPAEIFPGKRGMGSSRCASCRDGAPFSTMRLGLERGEREGCEEEGDEERDGDVVRQRCHRGSPWPVTPLLVLPRFCHLLPRHFPPQDPPISTIRRATNEKILGHFRRRPPKVNHFRRQKLNTLQVTLGTEFDHLRKSKKFVAGREPVIRYSGHHLMHDSRS
ncbi:hypothetical protein T484DRAFT_3639803 [Baffinella frigidus]|nr:hypothetical protein T484DRAFT_3639803 [Cryptophyta sp. CCMP2293]